MAYCELSLGNFREILNFDQTNPENVEFWLISDSLHPAERITSDRKLILLYKAFCKNDPVITIMARRISDSSSSSSTNPHSQGPLVERLKLWGHVWNASGLIPPERVKHLKQIANDHPHFDKNARVFVQDLVFSTALWVAPEDSTVSKRRLASVHRPFYLGRPYFSDEAVADIMNTPVEEYILSDVLNGLSRQSWGLGQPHGVCEIRNLVPLFLFAFGWTLSCVPDEKLALDIVPAPERKRKENQGIVVTLKKTASRLMNGADMPTVQVPKGQPKWNIRLARDIKGKSKVDSIVPGEESD
jgi:hypothetical protein